MKLRLLVTALSLGAIVLGSLFVVNASVEAHSRPTYFNPAASSVLTTAPIVVEGWFTAELRRDPNWTFIRVTDSNGQRVDQGEIMLSQDRRKMSVALRPGLGEGRYQVTWRTFDDVDGAIFGECYVFYVGQSAADASYAAKQRVDGGGATTCERIDVNAREGTPVPGATATPAPAAAALSGGDSHSTPSNQSGGSQATAETDDGSDGIPVWGLVVGVLAGVAVGGIGGRLVGGSKS